MVWYNTYFQKCETINKHDKKIIYIYIHIHGTYSFTNITKSISSKTVDLTGFNFLSSSLGIVFIVNIMQF